MVWILISRITLHIFAITKLSWITKLDPNPVPLLLVHKVCLYILAEFLYGTVLCSWERESKG
jgi:hypothetical protein